MVIFSRFRTLLLRQLTELRWHTILAGILIYGISSWLLLFLCGEEQLTQGINFLYWLLVTASTVGYGDLSPVTPSGQLVVALFVIPVGLTLFAAVVGKIATYIVERWRQGIMGLSTLHITNHILIIGWGETRTLHLIRLLLREQRFIAEPRPIVLCVTDEIENPLPNKIQFVRVNSFKNDDAMVRAGVSEANCIIIDNPADDLTMTTALYCNNKNPGAHIIAYFQDEQLGQILQQHCPQMEVMPSIAIELLAKSAVDPGSSAFHQQLLSVEHGMTQYSLMYPQGRSPLSAKTLFMGLKERYDATFVGIRAPDSQAIMMNPALDTVIPAGTTIFYIADERLADINWEQFDVLSQEPV